ncbi:OLC1v1018300C1 [Oldenlandia corymbosa var. corymbosa]|uniref:OLC1v1018300C1 n=1 Tax=Oldenlandia corymbosa var. corymbosa TaxID=529605 RepID=A0AAV1EBH0_OLDCO|nr:OLC1v1018300C1 [Oldenlandia corymbosa var. corymbosa]
MASLNPDDTIIINQQNSSSGTFSLVSHSSAEDHDFDQRRRRSSISSEEEAGEYGDHFVDGFYSLSADVSESEGTSCCSSSNSSGSRRQPSSSDELLLDFHCGETLADDARPTLMLPVVGDRHVVIPVDKKPVAKNPPEITTEVELMKQRFAKLLLGEDMSGGGNGVCTALAISNAITNLAATVFGELWKLEPLPLSKKSTWAREMEWLLCVCDFVVELVPSVQEIPGNAGKTVEVMVPKSRPDLSLNLPVLKRLDAMLISILDGFGDREFYYVDREVAVKDGEYIAARIQSRYPPDHQRRSSTIRLEKKWWLPFPRVPKNGLSRKGRKHLEQCWKCTNHVYGAALAINNAVLSEMEVPQVYLDNLPKRVKACLGETLNRHVTASQLPTEDLVDNLDTSSEHSTLEIANKLEAAIQCWRQKYHNKEEYFSNKRTGRSLWSGSLKGIDEGEKSRVLARRAETLLRNLKFQFPGLPQTTLDKTKIQFNKDVGQAILEGYSRVIESLASNMMGRIEDLLYIDDATKLRAAEEESMSANLQIGRHKELTSAFNFQDHRRVPVSVLRGNSFADSLKKPATSCPPMLRAL